MIEQSYRIYNSEGVTADPVSESDIVLELISGNERTLHKIFKLHHHAVYNYVVEFVKSPALASDIVHDVFIKLWENRSAIKMGRSLKVLLFTIAEDHVKSILKRADKESAIKNEIMGYGQYPYSLSTDEAVCNNLSDFSEDQFPISKKQRDPDGNIKRSKGLLGLHIFKHIIRRQVTNATKLIRKLR